MATDSGAAYSLVIGKKDNGKPKVSLVLDKLEVPVGKNSFFRFLVDGQMETADLYFSEQYSQAQLVKKLLRGKDGLAGVEKLKKAGDLDEGIVASILTLGRLSNQDAIGALWDMIGGRDLKISVMRANVHPIPQERMEAFVKSEGIDGCAEWLFLKKDSSSPTLNMVRAMDALAKLINEEGAKTEGMLQDPETTHMFNLPKLVLTLNIMDRLGTPNGVNMERLSEIFDSLSNTGGYTVRGYMMHTLGNRPEIAKIALDGMYKETSWENACLLAGLLISPRKDIAEPVQKEIGELPTPEGVGFLGN